MREATAEDAVRTIIDRRQITPHFQPIVDLHHGTVLGWEVLSRGPASFPSAAQIFGDVGRLACWHGLEESAATPPCARLRGFHRRCDHVGFSSTSARVRSATRACRMDTCKPSSTNLGLDQRNFVVEITERASIEDYGAFERQIRHYLEQGFKIALDDLGAGHSGLVTLMTCPPHFMKLDMTLSRDIHRHSYKQRLTRSLIAFAASLDASLIAERGGNLGGTGNPGALGRALCPGLFFRAAGRRASRGVRPDAHRAAKDHAPVSLP